MLVLGPLFQITTFLIQFLALPFPAFTLSFAIGGIGTVFQVGIIYIHKELQAMSLSGCICERLHCDSSKRF